MPSRPIEACGAEHRPRVTATYASRLLRLAAGNALVLAAGLALIAGGGEIALRLAVPFMETREPIRFVPAVGYLREPLAEIRWTNYRDYWTAARANSWGFLDREPVSPSRAEASCHVALIGDSFVEAKQVPIADKVQVQLATRAAQALPGWDVTTSAFGTGGTGQLNQLPFYDVYARRLRPKLLVLVFVSNDFADNSAVLQALDRGWDPDRLPFVSAARDAEGALQLRPPDREHEAFRLPRLPPPPPALLVHARLAQNATHFLFRALDRGKAARSDAGRRPGSPAARVGGAVAPTTGVRSLAGRLGAHHAARYLHDVPGCADAVRFPGSFDVYGVRLGSVPGAGGPRWFRLGHPGLVHDGEGRGACHRTNAGYGGRAGHSRH